MTFSFLQIVLVMVVTFMCRNWSVPYCRIIVSTNCNGSSCWSHPWNTEYWLDRRWFISIDDDRMPVGGAQPPNSVIGGISGNGLRHFNRIWSSSSAWFIHSVRIIGSYSGYLSLYNHFAFISKTDGICCKCRYWRYWTFKLLHNGNVGLILLVVVLTGLMFGQAIDLDNCFTWMGLEWF